MPNGSRTVVQPITSIVDEIGLANAIVVHCGGDSLEWMQLIDFKVDDPRANHFDGIQLVTKPERRLRSRLSRRLGPTGFYAILVHCTAPGCKLSIEERSAGGSHLARTLAETSRSGRLRRL